MASQLVKNEQIETTVAKAKEVRSFADNMVQLGKERGYIICCEACFCFCSRYNRLAFYLQQDRAGGYTRMFRTLIRVGDAAPMAYIEFIIDRENELREAKPATPPPPQRAPLDP